MSIVSRPERYCYAPLYGNIVYVFLCIPIYVGKGTKVRCTRLALACKSMLGVHSLTLAVKYEKSGTKCGFSLQHSLRLRPMYKMRVAYLEIQAFSERDVVVSQGLLCGLSVRKIALLRVPKVGANVVGGSTSLEIENFAHLYGSREDEGVPRMISRGKREGRPRGRG